MQAELDSTQHTILMGSVLVGMAQFYGTRVFSPWAPGEKLQKGDVVVFQPVKGHPDGHVAMFDGKQWISDYKQDSIYAASPYKNGAPYVIYRRP